MVHKSCPDCDQQVPVACKACYCGYLFFEKRKIIQQPAGTGTGTDLAKSQISSDNIIGTKSRRTSRTKRERPDYYSASEYENQIRRLSRASVSSEKSASGIELPAPSPRKRGRPRKHGNKGRRTLKNQTEKPTTDRDEVKDVDVYSNIPPDQAFMYTVVLAEINRKLQGQWQGPKAAANGINGGTHASGQAKKMRRNSDVGRS